VRVESERREGKRATKTRDTAAAVEREFTIGDSRLEAGLGIFNLLNKTAPTRRLEHGRETKLDSPNYLLEMQTPKPAREDVS